MSKKPHPPERKQPKGHNPAGKLSRKPPTLSEKLAATLLMMVAVDANNNLVPVIPREEALQMTTKQILARFEFDHGIYVTWHGGNHPTNLTPRPVAKHRAKTKRDRKNIDKVKRAEKRLASAPPCCDTNDDGLPKCDGSCLRDVAPRRPRPKRPMQYTALRETHKRDFRTGRVERRAP